MFIGALPARILTACLVSKLSSCALVPNAMQTAKALPQTERDVRVLQSAPHKTVQMLMMLDAATIIQHLHHCVRPRHA